MDISIIIPNYNGQALLKQNLPKVLAAAQRYEKGDVEIVIADDASKDNSLEIITSFFDSIDKKNISGKLVTKESQKNSGFSSNVNRAVAIATGEICIFLNTDVVPHADFLEYLLPHFEDEKVFAVGCMDESSEGGKVVLRGRGIGKWQRGFLTHRR